MTKIRSCGFCHKPGHNVATCPTLKQKFLEGDIDAIGIQIQKAQNKVITTATKRRASTTNSKPERTYPGQRFCSYCHKSDHNARNCNVRRGDERFKSNKKSIQLHRRFFVAACKSANIGVGSLVKMCDHKFIDYADDTAINGAIYVNDIEYGIIVGFECSGLGVGYYALDTKFLIKRFDGEIVKKSISTSFVKAFKFQVQNYLKQVEIDKPAVLHIERRWFDGIDYTSPDFEVVHTPTKTYLDPRMFTTAWLECTGNEELEAKKLLF